MIVCYSKENLTIQKIISGKNPIPPYDDGTLHVVVNNPDILLKRGDRVLVMDDKNMIKIGHYMVPLSSKTTCDVITKKNCNLPIYLEELN